MRRALVALISATMGCSGPTTVSDGAPFRLEVAYSFPMLAPSDVITTFDFDGSGTLWAVSFEGAILRVRNGQVTRFEASSVVGADEVRDLFIDQTGRPWVTGGASLAVFDGQVWSRQGPTDFLGLSPKAGQVAVSRAGDVLLAVGDVDAGGLLLRRGDRWDAITPANSPLPSPLVNDIDLAADGSFWVASSQWQGDGGLSRVENGRLTAVFDRAGDGLLYNWIDDIAIAADRIWLGFAVPIYAVPGSPDGGIQELPLDGGRPTTWYPFESGLSSNRVLSLVRSAAGELWFTTSVDEDSVCRTCVAAIGMMDAAGRFRVMSHLNQPGLDPNEYLPAIRQGPGGAIYVARGARKEIARIVR